MKLLSAVMAATLLAGACVASNSANAIGRIGTVILEPGDPVSPATGTWVGSYRTSYTVWGDGQEHNNEVGTTFVRIHYVYGTSYMDCRNNLVAAADAAFAVDRTDCTLQ